MAFVTLGCWPARVYPGIREISGSRRVITTSGLRNRLPHPTTSQPSKLWKGVFAMAEIMTMLVTYDVLQEKIMRMSYGDDKAFFKYSLFLIFYNRITMSTVWNGVEWIRIRGLDLDRVEWRVWIWRFRVWAMTVRKAMMMLFWWSEWALVAASRWRRSDEEKVGHGGGEEH
ncbi:hypothetical protein EV2_002911 [Malus domestica]